MKAIFQSLAIFVLLMIAIVLLGIHQSSFITIISKVGSVGIGVLIGKLMLAWKMFDVNEQV